MADMKQSLNVLSNALNLRAQRHQVLASNIANADTPQYKARDFDFSKAMENVLAGKGGGVQMARTSARHLNGGGGIPGVEMKFRTETQSSVDGNTVDMDVERAQIAENAMQYEVLTRLISDRFQGMRSAIASN